jgi:selenocysteine lyase/cysteine desulfurase
MLTARPGDRALFPDLVARSYLAHCAIAPVSAPVRTAVDAVTASYARSGVGALGQWLDQRATLRISVAALLGVAPEDVAFVANTTTGVVDIAFSLPWHAGERVVVFDGEFPTNVTPWTQAAATFGLEVVRLPLAGFGLGGDPVADGEGLARLEAELRRGVRLVAVSAVQFQTGLAMPIAAMATLCHTYGAELFVDAIQGLGVVPLDLTGVDYLACGSHKWLMGIEGCALLYVAPSRVGALVPRLAGWLSHEDPVGFLFRGPGALSYDRPFRARADVFEGGAANGAGLAALGAAVDVIRAVGVTETYAHVQRWHDAIEAPLVDRGFTSLRSPTPGGRSGILALRPPPGIDAAGLVAPLGVRGVVLSAPDGCLRIAPSWPNALDEVPDVLAAFDAVAPQR